MDISEQRRQALRAVVARLGGYAAVVKKFGLTAAQGSYLSQLTAADSSASFGERSAANWEKRLRLAAGSLTQGTHAGTPVAALDEGEPLGDEYIQIRESEVRFAAGNGRTPLFDEVVASVPRTYRREWFITQRDTSPSREDSLTPQLLRPCPPRAGFFSSAPKKL